MIKREELSNPKSCLSRADDDEMVFVLLARDAAAPDTVEYWAKRRIELGKNKWDDEQIIDAQTCAREMRGEAVRDYDWEAACLHIVMCNVQNCHRCKMIQRHIELTRGAEVHSRDVPRIDGSVLNFHECFYPVGPNTTYSEINLAMDALRVLATQSQERNSDGNSKQ